MPLDFNPAYLAHFNRDGYVHVPQFLRTDEVKEFNRRMEPIYKKRFDEESEGDDD